METRRGTGLFVALILVHLVAISHQVDRGGTSLLENGIFGVLSPLQTAVAGTVRAVAATWNGYADLRGVRAENSRLKERLGVLELSLQEKQHMAREAERLRELLALQQQLSMETVVAQVVARDGVPWFRTFTVNKGKNKGVELDAPVLSPTGVIGRVIGVGPYAAKVQLLLDRDASVGVLFARTRLTGVTDGQVGFADSGSRELIINFVPSNADVQPGDAVVTSGLDQLFPKGLMVGRVVRIGSGVGEGLFKKIYVAPSADFEAVEEVLVGKPLSSQLDISETVQ
jgi:rod shape-determining protein MreC